MTRREDLARSAVMAAARFRADRDCAPDLPIDPFSLANKERIDVRLESLSSLEGMYAPDRRTIVLGSLRPRGRRSFTCAHELGHHVFGHGMCVDELLEEGSAPRENVEREFIADRFAAALLMPKLAVLSAFNRRQWQIATATSAQVYTIAGYLGVGYSTLVNYLEDILLAINRAVADGLRKFRPQAIRRAIAGTDAGLVIVDEQWTGRPVDVEVGDVVAVPANTLCDGGLVSRGANHMLTVRSPGTCWLRTSGWRAELRAMPAGFTGLAQYRFLEED